VLITLVCLVPQAYYGYHQISPLFSHFSAYVPSVPGFNTNFHSFSRYSYINMWRGQVVDVQPNRELIFSRKTTGWVTVNDYVLAFVDLETEQTIGKQIELPSGHHRPVPLDDRLFLIAGNRGRAAAESHEFVDGELKPFEFLWADYDPLTLIDGKLYRIQGPPAVPKISVSTVEAGKWTTPQEVVLPKLAGSSPADVTAASILWSSDFFVINDNGRIHVFSRQDGKLFYKRGLTLRSDDNSNETVTYGAGESPSIADESSDHGWKQVRDPAKEMPVADQALATVVDGAPVVLLVTGVETYRPTGTLYRFDGPDWHEETTIAFPFGSNRFRIFSPDGQSAPYIVATSSTGTGFAYRWERSGITEIPGQGPALTWKYVQAGLDRICRQVFYILVWGLLPSMALLLMVDLFTRADYSFGNQTVTLASCGHRALARLIDLSLIAAVTGLIAYWIIQDVNWYEVAESMGLKIDHPDLLRLNQAGYAAAITIGVMSMLLVLMQGIWSVTPGKLICGLRTVRTTLRPCGIASSLAREILFVFDSTYLLCWIPGLLTMGLTSHRQRLGDLLGGTLVVKSRRAMK